MDTNREVKKFKVPLFGEMTVKQQAVTGYVLVDKGEVFDMLLRTQGGLGKRSGDPGAS